MADELPWLLAMTLVEQMEAIFSLANLLYRFGDLEPEEGEPLEARLWEREEWVGRMRERDRCHHLMLVCALHCHVVTACLEL